MALPREHREEIEILARRWAGLLAGARRVEQLNRLATWLILICGGALLAFPELLGRSEWLVVPSTGGFLWGGWYKMYMVGRNRREARREAEEIEQRLKELCGPDAEFAPDSPQITAGGQPHDAFSDRDYG